MSRSIADWLPAGKKAAVVWSIDDIHPGKSSDTYEAGGDLEKGALGHVLWLLNRHPELKVTLFTTADWRQTSPFPTRKRAKIPYLNQHLYLAPILAEGTMALDRHPGFVAFLNGMPRTEVALHGLHHIHTGKQIPVEFQDEPKRVCKEKLEKAIHIFQRANIDWSPGIQPPGWNLPDGLAQAGYEVGLKWVASARDIRTPITPDAKTDMSGQKGVSLIFPERLPSQLIHFSSNFQATSPIDRAHQIIEVGGVLAVKAHIIKTACGHVALDGVDQVYMNYLDVVFRELKQTYGDSLWWTTMGEIAARMETV